MKLSVILLMCLALAACDAPADPGPVAVQVAEPVPFGESFRVRNSEIRGDIIRALEQQNIPYRLNEDGSIGYNAEDGEAIDRIGYDAIGRYAARN